MEGILDDKDIKRAKVSSSMQVFTEFKLQFVSDYYDGPLAGIVLINNTEYYFKLDADQDWEDRLYKYFVYDLPKHAMRKKQKSRSDFNRLIGTYWEYSLPESERCYHGSTIADHETYYTKWPAGRSTNTDVSKLEPIGCFLL